MSKYIKLDDAIDCECPLNEIWEDCSNCPLNDSETEPCKMGKWLKSLPTIDIVRCSECKNAFDAEGEIICNHLSGMAGLNVVVKADDFCSYGERIDNE